MFSSGTGYLFFVRLFVVSLKILKGFSGNSAEITNGQVVFYLHLYHRLITNKILLFFVVVVAFKTATCFAHRCREYRAMKYQVVFHDHFLSVVNIFAEVWMNVWKSSYKKKRIKKSMLQWCFILSEDVCFNPWKTGILEDIFIFWTINDPPRLKKVNP